MNTRALRHAGVTGVADRVRQLAARTVDRLQLVWQPQGAAWPAPAPVAVEPRRFFAGAADAGAPAAFAARFGAERERTLAAAEARCAGRFDLLGYRDLRFGEPLDWHLDPVADRGAPLEHWSRIDALDHAVVGDSKLIWELNRHQWFCELGQAWRLTGEPRFAEAWAGAVQSWMQANRPGLGINWASSLEAAIRIVSWCWALNLMHDAPVLDRSLRAEVAAWIGAHARHVERFLSYHYSPNTHLTGEALGLFHAGVVLPGLDGARRWRRLGRRILLAELDRQVSADGGHFELATGYHRYTAEIYLHFSILAARNGVTLPERVAARTQDLLDHLLEMRRPDGGLPSVGDDDGGEWARLARRAHDDTAGVFSVAAAWFDRADYAWAAGALQPETWWMLGADGCRRFDALDPAPPSRAPSRLFGHTGYAVMRSDWSREAVQLVFDCGALGCPVSAGHGHADLLAVQLSVAGRALLVDPGTGRYVAGAERDRLRSTRAHNTVSVDGRDQAEPTGLFGWRTRPGARLLAWRSDADHDFVDARHDAYRRLEDPVRHRRRVLYLKPRAWLLVDDLDGESDHDVEWRWQFAPDTVLVREDDRWRATHGGAALTVQSLSRGPLRGARVDGLVSPAYGVTVPAPALTVSARRRLPLRVFTVLLAGPTEAMPPARLERVAGGDRLHAAGHVITVDDGVVAFERVAA